VVALDGRPYALGPAIVRVQDRTGLLPLTVAQPDQVAKLLEQRQVPEKDATALADALADYGDADDLTRLNGAEAKDYEAAGRPPPRNAPLLTPWEVRSVMGWQRRPDLWAAGDPVARLLTAGSGASTVNPNTAPVDVLMAMPGLDRAGVQRVVRARQKAPLRGVDDLVRLAGNAQTLEPSRYTFVSDGSFRIEIMVPGRPLIREVAGQVTPQDERSPWRIDYVLDLPGKDVLRPGPPAGDALPVFPAPAP
jgi:general secretion pathway protein K